MIIGFFASETIIGLFNSDTEVIRLGSDYLRISIFSYFVSALSFVYAGAFNEVLEIVLYPCGGVKFSWVSD